MEVVFKPSKIQGTGAFASVDLPKGYTLGLAFTRVREKGPLDSQYDRTDLGKYVNHSMNPNIELMYIDNKVFYNTLREIKKGEELVLNYKTFPWEGKRDFSEVLLRLMDMF